MKPWTPSFFLPVLVLVLLGGCSKASFYPLAGSVGGATVGAFGGPGPAAGGAGTFELLPFQHHDATSAQTIADAPVYSVYLSDLFPFLKFNMLPCQLIDQEVHIDLTFTDKVTSLNAANLSRRMCVANSDAASNQVEYDINQSEVKLIYDSITYDGDIMQKYAQQNPKLTFQYVDYRLAKRTGDQDAFSNLKFQLGGNGRLVSKVFL